MANNNNNPEIAAIEKLFENTEKAVKLAGRHDDIKMNWMPQFFERTCPLYPLNVLTPFEHRNMSEEEKQARKVSIYLDTKFFEVRFPPVFN